VGIALVHLDRGVADEQPCFVEIPLQNPKTVTFVADSFFAGTKVLLIDPVAIRENAVTSP
jgi:hypothetical protein